MAPNPGDIDIAGPPDPGPTPKKQREAGSSLESNRHRSSESAPMSTGAGKRSLDTAYTYTSGVNPIARPRPRSLAACARVRLTTHQERCGLQLGANPPEPLRFCSLVEACQERCGLQHGEGLPARCGLQLAVNGHVSRVAQASSSGCFQAGSCLQCRSELLGAQTRLVRRWQQARQQSWLQEAQHSRAVPAVQRARSTPTRAQSGRQSV